MRTQKNRRPLPLTAAVFVFTAILFALVAPTCNFIPHLTLGYGFLNVGEDQDTQPSYEDFPNIALISRPKVTFGNTNAQPAEAFLALKHFSPSDLCFCLSIRGPPQTLRS